jgi:predicted ATPase
LVLSHLGELPSARAHLEQSIAFYDPQKHRPDQSQSMQDPQVTNLSYASFSLWRLGYPDQARQRIDEALTWARELSHPFSVAFALSNAGTLNQHLRNVQTAQERTEALMTLAREQGFPYWLAEGAIRQGWVLAEQGRGKEGIAQMHQGLAALRATGAELSRSYRLARLAEVYGIVGQAEEGLTLLAEALAVVDKTGERFYEAELYRLKGELLLAQHSRVGIAHQNVNFIEAGMVGGAHPTEKEDAEACFLKAIEVTKRQQAKSWELRASTSLARLWQQQGKAKEAHEMLSAVYNWFTEGFDTKDLQEAKALLDSLASSV